MKFKWANLTINLQNLNCANKFHHLWFSFERDYNLNCTKKFQHLSFHLRYIIFGSTLANQCIIKEINVGTGLATSYHSLTHQDPLIKYYLPCENTLFCFDFHVVPKHQRLVLKTETPLFCFDFHVVSKVSSKKRSTWLELWNWNCLKSKREGKWNNSSWIKCRDMSRQKIKSSLILWKATNKHHEFLKNEHQFFLSWINLIF